MQGNVRWMVAIAIAAALLLSACGGGGGRDTREAPVVTEITPNTGGVVGGNEVTIRGIGLANDFTGGRNAVLFGGVPAEAVVVQSDQEITCRTPPNALGPADVEVVKQHGTAVVPNGFTYYDGPTLTSLSPMEGTRDGGETITLLGSGFDTGDPGETIVSFGSTPSEFVTVLDDNTIEAITPVSFVETAVDVTVTNAYGEAKLLGGFTYKGPLPIVTDVAPNTGSTNGGELVTITGDFFTLAGGSLSVKFGNAPGVNVVRVNDQTLTCSTPISTVDGLVDVSVTNENGTGTLINGFTYFAPPPSLISVDPTSAPEGTETAITITGFGFLNFGAGTPTVTLGGEACTDIVVLSEQQITCTTPGLDEGTYDLVVTNNRGVATLTDAFSFAWIPEWITSYGSALFLSDDSNGAVSFGFSFPFFGSTFTSARAHSNGTIALPGPGSNFLYSGQFDTSNAQISVCAWDLNPSAAGDVYVNTIGSDLCVVTWLGVPWFSNSGSITAQCQMRANGAFAILYNAINFAGGGLVVGCGPTPPASGSDSVVWTNEPDVDPDTQTSQGYTSASFDLEGFAVVFSPDGNDGYTTRVYALN